MFMRAVVALGVAAALAVLVAGGPTTSAANGWAGSVAFTNQVASSPSSGGGYPVPPGSRVPVAGTCGPGPFNANYSESWIAVQPGTEDLVGSSKFFFDKYSTFYMFYLGAHQILNGAPAGNNQIQGYDCVSVSNVPGMLVQDMPPSWTNTTDPNADFDTQGRVYQTMLPFNSFFDNTKLHPDGEIDVSFSDDMGRHWVRGNGGQALEPTNNGSATTIYVARSVDDGVSFTPFVPVTIVNIISTATGGLPNTRFRDGIAESFAASPTYAGHLYLTYEDWDGTQMDVKFTQSTDGGLTWTTPVVVNDNVDRTGTPTDQFQPTVAAGPGGAVAIAFYDRRRAFPSDASVLSAA